MRIAQDSVVTFTYTVSSQGQVVDRCDASSPMIYIHGRSQMIAGLEEQVQGAEAGQRFVFSVPPEKAYGVLDEALEVLVGLDAFPEEYRPMVAAGFRFQAEHPKEDGRIVTFTVTGVEEGKARASGNHPMAGKALDFEVEVLEVRAATEHELEHGHVHGGAGCGMRDGSCSGDHCSRDGHSHDH